MQLRCAVLIALWTMLIGPILGAAPPGVSTPKARPTTTATAPRAPTPQAR
jgi:hypothetical protein